MASSPTSRFSLRLLIDTKTEKVIFAEASKPVVDFIFYMLCLPIGSVAKLLGNNDMAGSIGSLYQSVQDLNEYYMHSKQSKDFLLNPVASISSDEFCNLLPTKDGDDISSVSSSELSDFALVNKLNIEHGEKDKDYDKEEDAGDDNYYYEEEEDDYQDCESGGDYYYEEHANNNEDGVNGDYYAEEEDYDYDSEDCDNGDDYYYYYYAEQAKDNEDFDDDNDYDEEKGHYEDDENSYNYFYEEEANDNKENILINNGFVKDEVTFLVMDDLVIQPLTSIIEVVNKFNIKETREMIVELGMNEVSLYNRFIF